MVRVVLRSEETEVGDGVGGGGQGAGELEDCFGARYRPDLPAS